MLEMLVIYLLMMLVAWKELNARWQIKCLSPFLLLYCISNLLISLAHEID